MLEVQQEAKDELIPKDRLARDDKRQREGDVVIQRERIDRCWDVLAEEAGETMDGRRTKHLLLIVLVLLALLMPVAMRMLSLLLANDA